jgi:dolichol kinase
MFIGGLVFTLPMLALFQASGNFGPAFSLSQNIVQVLVVNTVATLVEALPFSNIDNILVPAVVIPLSQILIH